MDNVTNLPSPVTDIEEAAALCSTTAAELAKARKVCAMAAANFEAAKLDLEHALNDIEETFIQDA